MMRFWLYIACCLLAAGEYLKVVQAGSKIEEVPELIAVASDDKEDESDEEEPKRLVCYLNFETRPESKSKAGTIRVIIDKSGYDNNGDFSLGGEILKYSDKDFTCNQAARLWESDILFKGDLFQAKPRKAITIAAWIRLEEKPGQHSIFDTIGVSHNQGQYHFEVNDGIVRWFHRNENRITVFETMAHSVQKEKWTHVAGTYDSATKQAKIFIDGVIRNMTYSSGCDLSRDWATHAGIGNHLKHRPLRGSIDEFRIYNYALRPDEVKALVGACRATDNAGSRSDGIDDDGGMHSDNVKKVDEKREAIERLEKAKRRKRREIDEQNKSCTKPQ